MSSRLSRTRARRARSLALMPENPAGLAPEPDWDPRPAHVRDDHPESTNGLWTGHAPDLAAVSEGFQVLDFTDFTDGFSVRNRP